METTRESAGPAQERSVGGGQALFDFGAGDGQHLQAGAALGFVGELDGADDLGGRGLAEVRRNQTGFQFFERGAGELWRGGDDALDFVGQFAVRFAQPLFEFLK